jgi:multimeric flavodoxin WrbA/GNAT superfamily N-acetyltransferase
MIERVTNIEEIDIEELLSESESFGYQYLTKMINQWRTGENRFSKPNELLIVYKNAEKVIGIGGINEEPYLKKRDFGRLRDVYVLSQYRRSNIGTQIVEHLIEFGRKHFKTITLRVPENIEASPFYESLGFLKTGEIETVTHVKNFALKRMKAIGIIGSPRDKGSTAYLVHKVLEGLKDSDFETRDIFLADLDLEYCIGCKTCEVTRQCQHDDRFDKLKQHFWDADIITIGSPSYWGDVTGHLKVMFDRFTPFCNTIDGKTIVPEGKKGIAIALRAGSSQRENVHIIESIDHFYGHLGIKPVGNMMVENIETIEDLKKKATEIEQAYQLGKAVGQEFQQERPILAGKTGG